MPKRWHSRHDAQKSGSPLDIAIVADHKPYFMIYRYPDERRQYNAFLKRCQFDCVWKFGVSLETLLKKDARTPDEENYVYWFRRNCPVSLGDCTMNRLCRNVESKLLSIKNKWKVKGDSFNYAIYRSQNVSYSALQFAAVKKILMNYEAEMKSVPSYAKAFRLDDAGVSEYRAALTQLAIEELYCNCPNPDVLCNIILDGTCSGGGSSSMAWALCGDVMIRNLLKRNGGKITYLIQDGSGDIEYKGQLFRRETYAAEEDDIGTNHE